jgi:hypothetical protein
LKKYNNYIFAAATGECREAFFGGVLQGGDAAELLEPVELELALQDKANRGSPELRS